MSGMSCREQVRATGNAKECGHSRVPERAQSKMKFARSVTRLVNDLINSTNNSNTL